jgi:hypothetical protein
MEFNPTRGRGHGLTTVLGTPTLDEAHSNGAHPGKYILFNLLPGRKNYFFWARFTNAVCVITYLNDTEAHISFRFNVKPFCARNEVHFS